MTIDMSWITLVSGVVLPMLVALVTARVASSAVKAVMLAALSAVAGVVNALVEVGGTVSALDGSAVASAAVTTFLVAVGVHFGLLKPTRVTGSQGAIQASVQSGVGQGGKHRLAE